MKMFFITKSQSTNNKDTKLFLLRFPCMNQIVIYGGFLKFIFGHLFQVHQVPFINNKMAMKWNNFRNNFMDSKIDIDRIP